MNLSIKTKIKAMVSPANESVMDEIFTVYTPREYTKISKTNNLQRLKMLIATFKKNDEVLAKDMSVLSGTVKLNPLTITGDLVVVVLDGREKIFNKIKPVQELIIYEGGRN
ncbi:hypothetical protein UT300012_23330 [Paraclostridium bifermentans]